MSMNYFVYEWDVHKPMIDQTLSRIDINKCDFDSVYTYNGQVVPRTTRILEKCIGSKELMEWSNRLGLYQRQNYTEFLQTAADIGSYAHERIEHTVKNLPEPDFGFIGWGKQEKVDNAYNAFQTWWNEMNRLYNIQVVYSEEPLSCPYCGGTVDLLLLINGKHYLVDFKTSRYPNFKFFLQMASYRYMLRITRNIEIDGVVILMLDKNTGKYRELVMSFEDIYNLQLMNMYEQAFFSMVNTYYNLLYAESMFNTYMKEGHNVRYY